MGPEGTEESNSSAELPITVHIDGDMGAVEFIRRLARGGLALKRSDDNAYAVVVRQTQPAPGGIRDQLFEAAGIVATVRLALATNMEANETPLQDALQAAWRIIDNVASALEGTDHG